MRRLLRAAMFAVLSGPSLGACRLQVGCDPEKCTSDCPENCPHGVYGADPDSFAPPPPESCPANADRICADDHLYTCQNGKRSSPFYSCGPGTTCVEVLTSDGRSAAACATGDDACMDDAPRSAECRGDDRIACEYGLVTLRAACLSARCAVSETDQGDPIATCALAD